MPQQFLRQNLEATPSTNDVAKQHAAHGAPEGTLITATEQTSGRGRQGRVWHSPPGNLYASLVLRPQCSLAVASQASFIIAIALQQAFTALLPPSAAVRLKWPNDVLVNGKKVAGILLESESTAANTLSHLVIGFGVNILHHPPLQDRPVTSLLAEGANTGIPEVLSAIETAFWPLYAEWQAEGFSPIKTRWQQAAWNLGQPVNLQLANEKIAGTFIGLAEDGALVLEQEGVTRHIYAGDVVLGH